MAEEAKPGDDKAAADWAAMLEAEEKQKTAGTAAKPEAPKAEGKPMSGAKTDEQGRVLNQDEIDLLLGFDAKKSAEASSTGIHAILDKALMAYEKLPMIEVVFDRMVRSLSSSMRNFMSDNVDISIDSMTSMRFDDYLNSIPLPALLVVFRAVEWENFGVITIDSSQIYSTVDVLLGGRRSGKPVRIEGRPYTTIEQDIIKRMVDVVLADMSVAFEPISPVTFQFDRLETNPRFATVTRPSNAVLLVRLRVDIEDRGGIIEIMFPHATLEPIRDLLHQLFMGEKFGADTAWEKHLARELRTTDVPVEAVLSERTLMLGEVMKFKVGSTFLLDRGPDEEITLRCGNVPLVNAKLGRSGDNIAVSITESLRKRLREEST